MLISSSKQFIATDVAGIALDQANSRISFENIQTVGLLDLVGCVYGRHQENMHHTIFITTHPTGLHQPHPNNAWHNGWQSDRHWFAQQYHL